MPAGESGSNAFLTRGQRQALPTLFDDVKALKAWTAARTATEQQQTAAGATSFVARRRRVPLGAVALGAREVAVVWPTPMPDAAYMVVPTIEVGTAVLGSLTAMVKAGSVTAAGCTVYVVAGLLIAAPAGAVLDVAAIRV